MSDKEKNLNETLITDREAIWKGDSDEDGRSGNSRYAISVSTGSLGLDIALRNRRSSTRDEW